MLRDFCPAGRRSTNSAAYWRWPLAPIVALLISGGCSYDYDAPFQNGAAGMTDAASGSNAGGGGSGGTSEMGGSGGDSGADAVWDQANDYHIDQIVDAPADPSVNQTDSNVSDVVQDAGRCPVETHACFKAPDGWSGPFAYLAASAVVTCMGGFSQPGYQLFQEVRKTDASCSVCACAPATGKVCSMDLNMYTDEHCDNSCGKGEYDTSTCKNVRCDDVSIKSIKFKTRLDPQATCEPSKQEPNIQPVEWGKYAVLCSPPPVHTCEADAVCLPKDIPPQFSRSLCIARAGDEQCPAPYLNKHSYFQNALDTRGCSECSCGAPQQCSGQMWLNESGPTCDGEPETYPLANPCWTLTQGAKKVSIEGRLSASCIATGGSPKGEVTEDWNTVVTVCCAG